MPGRSDIARQDALRARQTAAQASKDIVTLADVVAAIAALQAAVEAGNLLLVDIKTNTNRIP